MVFILNFMILVLHQNRLESIFLQVFILNFMIVRVRNKGMKSAGPL